MRVAPYPARAASALLTRCGQPERRNCCGLDTVRARKGEGSIREMGGLSVAYTTNMLDCNDVAWQLPRTPEW
eukprot:356742-Chlamydomonas_euryale.AAC.5